MRRSNFFGLRFRQLDRFQTLQWCNRRLFIECKFLKKNIEQVDGTDESVNCSAIVLSHTLSVQTFNSVSKK